MWGKACVEKMVPVKELSRGTFCNGRYYTRLRSLCLFLMEKPQRLLPKPTNTEYSDRWQGMCKTVHKMPLLLLSLSDHMVLCHHFYDVTHTYVHVHAHTHFHGVLCVCVCVRACVGNSVWQTFQLNFLSLNIFAA